MIKRLTALLAVLFLNTGMVKKGAYILGSEGISSFEEKAGGHFSYIYHAYEGSEVSEKWLLECIAYGKEPFIVIAPKDKTKMYDIAAFAKTIDSIKIYSVPVMISIYPCPKGIYDADDYREFFKKASKTAKVKLKNVQIVWSTDNAYESFEYFVQDSVDIAAFEAYEKIENGKTDYKFLDYWYFYKKLSRSVPVMISGFAVSHRDYGDQRYYIAQAKNEIEYFYKNVSDMCPLTQSIYYINTDTSDCDFSVLSDNEVLESYRKVSG